MAADQRRKQLLGVSIRGSSSWQQCGVRRKNLEFPHNDLNMKSHISLEWDDSKKRIVAKSEQISISWRDLRPFNDYIPHHQNVLADVFAIPHEIFELENLTHVLSYEVWQSHLSENERNFLVELLPRGLEPQQVLQALVAGDSFHFGNPFLKWGVSLCSGSLHPDVVLHREQCLKADKKTYYSNLQKYHNDMIGCVLKLKERWENCTGLEKEIMQKLWSSRDGLEGLILSCGNEYIYPCPEDDFTATSESYSAVAGDKVCSSDNQNFSVIKGAELLKRVSEKCFMKYEDKNLWIASDEVLNFGGKPRNEDKLHKHNIHRSDGANYMSYFKISKKQHELFKNMKQSGKSIQSMSLNRVLGNIDSFHVLPYEVFVEEEQKKFHHHWSQLANEVLPMAYANWREKQFQRWVIINSWEQEMKDKLTSLMEDGGNENLESMLQDQEEDELTNVSAVEDDEGSVPGSPKNEFAPGSPQNEDSVSGLAQNQESTPGFSQNQTPQQISSQSGGHEGNIMDMDSEKNHIMSKSDNGPGDQTMYLGNFNTADVVSQGVVHHTYGDVWPAVSMPQSYDSTASHDFTAASGLPLEHSQVNDQQRAHLIDLESDLLVEQEGFLHRESGECSFISYPNQDCNELLQSLFKSQGILSYHQKQKQKSLEFQPRNNLAVENGHFPGHSEEHERKRQNGVYVPRNIPGNIYSDGVRYLIPRQEHLARVTVQGLAANTICMPSSFQSGLNSGESSSQNWFSGEHQVHGGWNGSDGTNLQSQSNSMGSGGGADLSIFQVLPHCNQLCPSGLYDSVGFIEQFVALRNYGMVAAGTPRINNVLPQVSHPLDYLSRREAATSTMPDDIGWMNLQHQNAVLHDPMGKPYLRSWNE